MVTEPSRAWLSGRPSTTAASSSGEIRTSLSSGSRSRRPPRRRGPKPIPGDRDAHVTAPAAPSPVRAWPRPVGRPGGPVVSPAPVGRSRTAGRSRSAPLYRPRSTHPLIPSPAAIRLHCETVQPARPVVGRWRGSRCRSGRPTAPRRPGRRTSSCRPSSSPRRSGRVDHRPDASRGIHRERRANPCRRSPGPGAFCARSSAGTRSPGSRGRIWPTSPQGGTASLGSVRGKPNDRP